MFDSDLQALALRLVSGHCAEDDTYVTQALSLEQFAVLWQLIRAQRTARDERDGARGLHVAAAAGIRSAVSTLRNDGAAGTNPVNAMTAGSTHGFERARMLPPEVCAECRRLQDAFCEASADYAALVRELTEKGSKEPEDVYKGYSSRAKAARTAAHQARAALITHSDEHAC